MRRPLVSRVWRTSCKISGRNGLFPRVSFSRCIHVLATNVSDPENLLVMMRTWQNGDVSKQSPYNGNFEAALGSIRAKIMILPAKTDLYFP